MLFGALGSQSKPSVVALVGGGSGAVVKSGQVALVQQGMSVIERVTQGCESLRSSSSSEYEDFEASPDRAPVYYVLSRGSYCTCRGSYFFPRLST